MGSAKANQSATTNELKESTTAEGEPCPVCGSEEHPYTSGAFAALARAAKEITKRRKGLEAKIESTKADLQEARDAEVDAKSKATSATEAIADAKASHGKAKRRYSTAIATAATHLKILMVASKLEPTLSGSSEERIDLTLGVVRERQQTVSESLVQITGTRIQFSVGNCWRCCWLLCMADPWSYP